MQFPLTVIIRHRKENLKKCSLTGLEKRKDLCFLTYPFNSLPDLDNYVVLALDGEELSIKDTNKGVLLLDSTWRYLPKVMQSVEVHGKTLEKRALPSHFKTAYPRTQEDCQDPSRGLSSLEALYVTYQILGRPTEGLLDRYYWKEKFLLLNNLTLTTPGFATSYASFES